MANGPMSQQGMNPNQQNNVSPEQQDEMQGYLEDMILNDFVQKDMAFENMFNQFDSSIKYNNLSDSDKHAYNQKAFTYYNKNYVDKVANKDGSPSIKLENFILMWNPGKDFQSDLTNFSLGTKETDATDFVDIFNSDIELHRRAAIEGYKQTLMTMDALDMEAKLG